MNTFSPSSLPSASGVPNGTAISADFEFAALREAYYYPRAIVAEFAPYLGSAVLEVGAGVGQLTTLFAQRVGEEKITAVEPDSEFSRIFRESHPAIRLIEGTAASLPSGLAFDTIVSVNVIEHIRDHVEEFSRYRGILKASGGHLCILAPARPELYAPIDRDFGHFRRYTKKSMVTALLESGFSVKKIYYFNAPGYFAWLVNFRLLRSRGFNPRMVRLYDRLVFRWAYQVERSLMRPPFGQSLITIAQA